MSETKEKPKYGAWGFVCTNPDCGWVVMKKPSQVKSEKDFCEICGKEVTGHFTEHPAEIIAHITDVVSKKIFEHAQKDGLYVWQKSKGKVYIFKCNTASTVKFPEKPEARAFLSLDPVFEGKYQDAMMYVLKHSKELPRHLAVMN
jgi:hypothetical protein